MIPEQQKKLSFELSQMMESQFHIRILESYQCIKCGRIFDKDDEALDHVFTDPNCKINAIKQFDQIKQNLEK